jgi:hypothetical protein
MFEKMNVTLQQGFVVGAASAVSFSLSWLQAFYAVLTAFFLPKTPEALMSLNFLCLLAAQLSILQCLTVLGCSPRKAIAASLLLFLPAALTNWDGGYQDMRRDASLFPLLVACYFLASSYLLRPSFTTGIWLGIMAGLAQWSRGNALPYLALVLLPAAACGGVMAAQRREWRRFVTLGALSCLVFLLLAAPYYYYTIQEILTKYLTGSTALGFSPWQSLRAFWWSPVGLVLGVSPRERLLQAGACALLLGVIGLFLRVGIFRLGALKELTFAARWFLWSGVAIAAGVVCFNCVVLGVQPQSPIMPFFPAMVGTMGVLCGALLFLHFNAQAPQGEKWRNVALGVFAVAVVSLAWGRMYITSDDRSGPANRSEVETVRRLSVALAEVAGEKYLAFAWVGRVNQAVLNFYITQAGGAPTKNFEINSRVVGHPVDLHMPPDPRKAIADQQRELALAFDLAADTLVVTTDVKQYESRREQFFVFWHGRSVIERILQSPRYEPIFAYESEGLPFVVLHNRGN